MNERTNKPTNSDLDVPIKLTFSSLLVSFNFLANFTSKSTVLQSIFKFVPENLPGFVDPVKSFIFYFHLATFVGFRMSTRFGTCIQSDFFVFDYPNLYNFLFVNEVGYSC